MKAIFLINSQNTPADDMFIPDVFIKTIIVILLFYVASSFILTLVRTLLNHRLKSKMISMGIIGEEAERMLRTGTETKNYAVRWCLLLLSGGIGFIVISFFPFGWLSAGVLAFCLALGYAGYFLYLNNQKNAF